MRYAIRLNSGSEVVEVLDDEKSCGSYYPGDLCGGCERCLLEQASFYGWELIPETSPEFKEVVQ